MTESTVRTGRLAENPFDATGAARINLNWRNQLWQTQAIYR
jgi:hypothetical protein